MWAIQLIENENFTNLEKKLFAIPSKCTRYQRLFLPIPSFYGYQRLTKSTEKLGFGSQWLRTMFQYAAF